MFNFLPEKKKSRMSNYLVYFSSLLYFLFLFFAIIQG